MVALATVLIVLIPKAKPLDEAEAGRPARRTVERMATRQARSLATMKSPDTTDLKTLLLAGLPQPPARA
ncbi:hypothetical protein [Streptomyces sp. NRRL F-5135]|uniref:hypothetical protein n=1 Tax=Streptomyces sp. NRRL F-5135 TaxID=1463858 RepID=UPI0004C8E613|nr:hypothetical protein [Streptomyces sp. NRRL F-5135]